MAVALSPGLYAQELELQILLEDGRFYRSHDLYRQCNLKLKADYDLTAIEDQLLELGPAEKLSLLLADTAGLLRVEIRGDMLLVRIPDASDEAVRLRSRRRVQQIFGLSMLEWPPGKGMHFSEGFDPKRRTILLVHGLESGVQHLRRFKSACDASGIQTVLFDYPNDGPPAHAGERLARDLQSLSQQYPSLRLAIVAHSLGGLVARHALATGGSNLGCVTDLFTLGTPHHGTPLAGSQDWLELLFEAAPGLLSPAVVIESGLGEAAADLQPHSKFLNELNQRPFANGVRYHLGIGTKGVLSKDEVDAVTSELLAAFRRRGVEEWQQKKLLELLYSEELRTGHGDGAVAVRSARLRGAASERLFRLTHSELVSLPGAAPEDHEVFRWIVESLKWERISP